MNEDDRDATPEAPQISGLVESGLHEDLSACLDQVSRSYSYGDFLTASRSLNENSTQLPHCFPVLIETLKLKLEQTDFAAAVDIVQRERPLFSKDEVLLLDLVELEATYRRSYLFGDADIRARTAALSMMQKLASLDLPSLQVPEQETKVNMVLQAHLSD